MLAVFFATYIDIWAHIESAENVRWTILIPVATLLLTAIGTFAAVFFGWRIDRRQSKELELKIKELAHRLNQTGESNT